MEFSRANGSEELFKKLKEAGHYPYSDLEIRQIGSLEMERMATHNTGLQKWRFSAP